MKHYQQTKHYTCDPACLMMAMHCLGKRRKMVKAMEMQLWKEANLRTVQGCLPQGLALSAIKRGFHAEITCKKEHFCETTSKDNVSIEVAKRQLNECIKHGVKINYKMPGIKDIKEALSNGGVPLLLVNSFRIHGIKSPHWIVVTGIDNQSVSINDPYNKHGKDVQVKREDLLQMMDDLERYSEIGKRMLLLSK